MTKPTPDHTAERVNDQAFERLVNLHDYIILWLAFDDEVQMPEAQRKSLAAASHFLASNQARFEPQEPAAEQASEQEAVDQAAKAICRTMPGPECIGICRACLKSAEAALSVRVPAPDAVTALRVPAVVELVEMIDAAETRGGAMIWEHTPEEIGLHVMKNSHAVRAALASKEPG